MSQTIPVRKGEELNLEVIKQYLVTHIENVQWEMKVKGEFHEERDHS
jgi:hypothetical protein